MTLRYQSGCFYNQPTNEKPMKDTLRNRLQEIADTLILAIDEMDSIQTKPSPKLTDDQIIAELEKLSRINPVIAPTSAFYAQAAKRFTVAIDEIKELEEAILDWHVLTNSGGLLYDFGASNRLHEIGDIIRKSRKGGNQ
jgi:hypothetical protein